MSQDIPVGCIITEHNTQNIISTAYNTRELDNNISGHAEINAINQAAQKSNNWRLDNHDIYINLEPCLMCTGAIIQARFRRVIFGAYNYQESHSHLISQAGIEVIGGVLEQECQEFLQDFFKRLREK